MTRLAPTSGLHSLGLFLLTLVGGLLISGGSCEKKADPLPDVKSKEYGQAVRAFYVGVAALEAGSNDRALTELTAASKIARGEPAIWANIGILDMRSDRLPDAEKHFETARSLAQNDGRIHFLIGLLHSRLNKPTEAGVSFHKAVELDPKNLRAKYALVEHLLQEAGGETEAKSLLENIVVEHPANLVARLDLARVASKAGDAAALAPIVATLTGASPAWPQQAQERFADFKKAVETKDTSLAATTAMFLQNLLKPVEKYKSDIVALKAPSGVVGEPIRLLIMLPNPPPDVAPPDTGLAFAESTVISEMPNWGGAAVVYLTADGKPTLLTSNMGAITLLGSDQAIQVAGGRKPAVVDRLVAADLNSDSLTDLSLIGGSGINLYQQGKDGKFTDVTAKARLTDTAYFSSYLGGWAADFDLDGDLDLMVAPIEGGVHALRNNGDGTFKLQYLLGEKRNVRDFVWADLDNDGDPDAVTRSDSGNLSVFLNDRSGDFHVADLPSAVGTVAAVAVVDANGDGQLDIVVLSSDGAVKQLSAGRVGASWTVAELGKWENAFDPKGVPPRLLSGDLDNNGGVDIIASTESSSRVWLCGAGSIYSPLAADLPGGITGVADLDGDGRLDLVGVAEDGSAIKLQNSGKLNYGFQEIRPRATFTKGDQRINSFGVGGVIEIRAGMLTQTQPINGPVVHFGLGENKATDVARVFWPNGRMQAEFDLKAGQSVTAIQRLEGSCPWVFAWNGKEMEFITDFIWRSPLGLKINAQDTGAVAMTEDWVRIRGDQLKPVDGLLDVRITAELRETHFFDHVSLMTVDHPAGTEVYVDERFAIPPPPLRTFVTGKSVSFTKVVDDAGADVTRIARDLDGSYVDNFGRGQYQGVTRDHYVEVDFSSAPRTKGPLYLIAQGWIHPTDSSINVAISQGSHPAPKGLSIETPTVSGKWVTAQPGVGFPAGKNKTIVLDVSNLFQPGAPRRLRLRTNLEIFWDRLAWAEPAAAGARTVRTLAQSADLVYRGFSNVTVANPSSPELPAYAPLKTTVAQWCDLEGYHTRFGDVIELLTGVDDRYVIMNAGDEMRLKFPASPPPAIGWVRDYVLVGDGWEKDGNLNTYHSRTVLPLPSHDNPKYHGRAGQLEDDPVYKRYAKDWQTFHTRYVTPDAYWNALRASNSR